MPKKEVVDRIAKKVGYEIYDLLNYERPDPFLDQIIEKINDPSERQLLQEFLDYISGLDDEGRKEIHRRLHTKKRKTREGIRCFHFKNLQFTYPIMVVLR